MGGDKRNLIINVGRVERKAKQQHLLIEAFNKIKCNYKDWKIEIWGEYDIDKKYYEYCCELIKKYGLEEKIKFCGTTNKVIEKMQNAKIFAFPSAYEGWGMAMTEAMSCGLPVVGFRSCAGVNELVKDGYSGFLCENIDDFASKLEKLMNNDKLCLEMGINAYESMKEYAPEKVWNQWDELIYKSIKYKECYD